MAETSIEVYDPNTKAWLTKSVPLDHNTIHTALQKVLGKVEIEIRVFNDGKFQVLKPELTQAQKDEIKATI